MIPLQYMYPKTEQEKKIALLAIEYETLNSAVMNKASEEQSALFLSKAKFGIVGHSIGFIGGLVYAFQKDKGFWAYIGYSLLFGLIGGTAGGIIDFATYDSAEHVRKTVTPVIAAQIKDWIKRSQPYKTDKYISDRIGELNGVLNKVK
jgi:hypothetical protein